MATQSPPSQNLRPATDTDSSRPSDPPAVIADVAKGRQHGGVSHEDVTDDEERGALDYLLTDEPPAEQEITVTLETDRGPRRLTFVFTALDSSVIEEIEERHATGFGLARRVNAAENDPELVARATKYVIDCHTRRQMTLQDLRERPGRQPYTTPAEALRMRFGRKGQSGLLAGVASAIRQASGYDGDRIGKVHRRGVSDVQVAAAGAFSDGAA